MAAWKACFLPRGSQEHSPLCLPCCSKILRCWKNWQPMATIQTSRLLGINFALPPFFCVMQSSVQLSEEGKNPTSLQSIAAAALRESRSNKGTDMHRHTRYSPCSKRMASCMSWLSLWVIVKAQEGVVGFFFASSPCKTMLALRTVTVRGIQMVAVQTEVRKHICTQSSQPTLAGDASRAMIPDW